jgi:hypothetical protein
MANRAYLRVWTRDFSEATMIAEFARFLTTAPLAESRQFFNELIVQAVDPTEAPVAEWDVHDGTYGAPEIAALAAQHLNSDTSYIVHARWDLWTFDVDTVRWKRGPQPLILTCNGPDYDNGAATTEGHFTADLGFEHLFTGHAGILAPGAASNSFHGSDHPIEKTFRNWMSVEANRREYAGKTRENIQHLMSWVESASRALPVERSELCSEGEENFEARLDAILALR